MIFPRIFRSPGDAGGDPTNADDPFGALGAPGGEAPADGDNPRLFDIAPDFADDPELQGKSVQELAEKYRQELEQSRQQNPLNETLAGIKDLLTRSQSPSQQSAPAPIMPDPTPLPNLDINALKTLIKDKFYEQPDEVMLNVIASVVNYTNASQGQKLAAIARQAARYNPGLKEIFDKYEVEIEMEARRLAPTGPDLDTYHRAAKYVQANHFEEFAQARAVEIMKTAAPAAVAPAPAPAAKAPGGFAGGTGAAASAGSPKKYTPEQVIELAGKRWYNDARAGFRHLDTLPIDIEAFAEECADALAGKVPRPF